MVQTEHPNCKFASPNITANYGAVIANRCLYQCNKYFHRYDDDVGDFIKWCTNVDFIKYF